MKRNVLRKNIRSSPRAQPHVGARSAEPKLGTQQSARVAPESEKILRTPVTPEAQRVARAILTSHNLEGKVDPHFEGTPCCAKYCCVYHGFFEKPESRMTLEAKWVL